MSDSLNLTKFVGLLKAGVSLEQSIEQIGRADQSSKGLRYLLQISLDSGSAIASELEFVAELFSSRERNIKRIEIAHASPKSTARLMLLLPLLILGMAEFLGWGALGSLTQRPIIAVSIFLGLALLLISKVITSSLLKRAKPAESFAGFYLLGVALQISSGTNLYVAQSRATENYADIFDGPPPLEELTIMEQVAELVEQKGARANELLRKQAKLMQEKTQQETELKIEKLGVKLMVPLGLGVLPAFVFLAIVPLMVTTLGAN
jgi:tight adherence protein B